MGCILVNTIINMATVDVPKLLISDDSQSTLTGNMK